jgi:hypothetical protein
MAILLLFLSILGSAPQHVEDAAILNAAKRANVQKIDPTLPPLPFEIWLKGVVGPAATITWTAGNCGAHPADAPSDLPVCGEARVTLSRGRELSVTLNVGSEAKGVANSPAHLEGAYVRAAGGASKPLEKLSEVPGAIKETPSVGIGTAVPPRR